MPYRLEPHPASVLAAPSGRRIELKVHRCLWSGQYPENSLAAIEECYRQRVARAEIDIAMLRDADFLVVHDVELEACTTGSGRVSDTTRAQASRLRLQIDGAVSEHSPPLLSEVVATIAAFEFPTLLELDLKDTEPWPWARVEELCRLVEGVHDRVILAGYADWNLRRVLRVDPTTPVGFNPAFYLDWQPEGDPLEALPGLRGAYGYLDAHPLARERRGPVSDYLADRLGGILRLVPGAREAHLRLQAFERMLDDGVADAAELFHREGMVLDVWTLDAGTPHWRRRLARAVAAGVDVVTTNTAPALAALDLVAVQGEAGTLPAVDG